ncbi:hypothetical protein APR03_004662 [Promicromonospora thailandica]|uniref:CAAX prenyl protease 2/Lysostaphin resistance protein A-like domain-containing protein n=2 Tax=Promicromonospora thailandica TaxID=765201 RepID=A0A9X2K0P8_9MICO|nr:hypothetical protein [Promicromonospora thailandica]
MTPDAVPPPTEPPATVPAAPGRSQSPSSGPAAGWFAEPAPVVGPREYPQALRGPRHRWWRPLVGLGTLVGALVVVAGSILLLTLGFVVAQLLGVDLPDPTTDAFLVSPAGMLVTNLGLAVGIPVALVATWAQAGRPGLVSSVLGRVRWRLVLGGLGLSLLLLLPLTVASSLLVSPLVPADPAAADDGGLWPLTPAAGWLALSVVILLTTPLQAAGEEYFFRGWASQWLGSLLRWRWLAVIVPAVVTALLFAMAHGAQSPWLFADRLVFGLVASLLVWRTGGLELAVALHVANNLVAFGLAIAYDGLADSLLITEVAPAEGAASITTTLVTAAVLLWWGRRQRPAVVVEDPGPTAVPAGAANGATA